MAGDYGDLMAKLIEAFEGEAEERLQELNKATLALEQSQDPAEGAELIKVIFREAHTLKGTAGGLGLKSIERVGHSMETIFGLLRSGEMQTSPEMFDIIYRSLDAMGELAKSAARSQPDPIDVAPLVEALNELANKPAAPPKPAPVESAPEPEKPAEPAPTAEAAPLPAAEPEKAADTQAKKRKSRPPAQIPPPKNAPKPAPAPEPPPPAAEAPKPAEPPAPIPAPVMAPVSPEPDQAKRPPRLLIPGKSEPAPQATAQTPLPPADPAVVETASLKKTEKAEPAAEPKAEKPAEIPAQAITTIADAPAPVAEVKTVVAEAPAPAPIPEPKPAPPVEPKPAPAVESKPVAAPAPVAQPSAPAAPAAAARAPEESIRVSTSKLDILMEQVAELQTARINAEQRLTEARELLERAENWDIEWRQIRSELWRMGLTNGSNAQNPSHVDSSGSAAHAFDTRSMQNLSEFLESNAGNLKNSLVQLTGLVRNFDSDSRRMAQVMADLQDGVRRIRMLPISTVFETFPRMVRDTARAVQKEVNLVIRGGENEVDRTILEQVKAPLVHLLRNAVDHGLESTDTRLAAGKPRQGTVNLTAAQRGANLQVEVSEDGGGIDVRKVRDSAVRKGLLSPEAAAAMSDQEAMWLIFRPGFSTKSTVTDLSGRGVGLDVVRENVEGLGGMIDVKSELGVGTTFTLTLPMSVATTLVMIVECGNRRIALPVTNVLRIMQIDPSRIGQLRGRSAIDFEGRPIALTHLADALGMAEGRVSPKTGETAQALIVGSADKRYAFMVDGVLGAQEVVVKSLLPPLDRVRRVAGATILGTGEVVMVLNVADLIRSTSLGNFGVATGRPGLAGLDAAGKEQKPDEPPLVLCVDDSFTTRTLIKSIVEAAGYRTEQAIDGMDAWSKLQNLPIRLVVTDVNMPRMDGFELTRTIRKDQRTKDLPVVLVTSLDSPEEKAEGVQAGADAHIVKGALRQEDLLETIKRLL